MASIHGLSGHFQAHPVRGVVEVLSLLFLTIATLIALEIGARDAQARPPVHAVDTAQVEEEAPIPEQKRWVWKRRASRDNPVYAFGER